MPIINVIIIIYFKELTLPCTSAVYPSSSAAKHRSLLATPAGCNSGTCDVQSYSYSVLILTFG